MKQASAELSRQIGQLMQRPWGDWVRGPGRSRVGKGPPRTRAGELEDEARREGSFPSSIIEIGVVGCFFFLRFFLMWTILKSLLNVLQYCFCCFLCFGFLTARHVGS